MISVPAWSAGLQWQFLRSADGVDGSVDRISYQVLPHVSVIEYPHEIIHIDYNKMVLYRYDKTEHACTQFPIDPRDPKDAEGTTRQQQRETAQVGSIKRIPPTEIDHKDIQGYRCQLQHLLFGADLAVSQMIVPLVVEQYKQKFTERLVSYYVSEAVSGYSTLLEMAHSREEVFQNNPLLRQIDIVGLMNVLQGFPVQVREKIDHLNTVTTLSIQPELFENKEHPSPPGPCKK